MSKLSAAIIERVGDQDETDLAARQASDDDATTAPVMARIRLLMIISGLTTLVAIAAVLTVIGYRVFRTGNNGLPSAASIITLPKGARVIANSIAGDQLVVTVDIAGATEIRTFDLKTLKETGRVRFVTAP
ncbi:MAG: DUF6476 family protein [Xanthobacteraceae bacterium]|nr:DUF6476 family protein [Xanthobacteraceae bacterium]